MTHSPKRVALGLVAATVLGAAFRLHGLAEQAPFTDEIQMAFTARAYVERGQFVPSMPHHPNLRNLLLAGSLDAFGDNVLALRTASVALGILTVPLLGLLVLRLVGSPAAAVLAAFVLATDPLHVTFSRQAIQETHAVFFALLGAYLVLRGCDERAGAWTRPGLFVTGGLAFGLGMASKYQVLFPLLVCAAVAAARAWRARDGGTLTLAFVTLGILPLAVLLATDAPWFGRGYGLEDWVFMRTSVLDRMSAGYVPAEMEMNPDRHAWKWFVHPLQGYASFTTTAGRPLVTVGMGNPIVWLLVLPSSFFLLSRPEPRARSGLLQALFWASYLPFVFASRPIFFLSALAAAPFGFGLVAAAAAEWATPARRKYLFTYGGALALVGVLMFPLCSGRALDFPHTAALVARFNPHP